MNGPGRLGPLDSLRGIAAAAVVAHHVWLTISFHPQSPWLWRALRYTPADILIEGRFPVILFFVLSGLVLVRAADAAPSWRAFAARRILRIWPPFAAALLLSAALRMAIRPAPIAGLGPWFNDLWTGGLAPAALLMPASVRETLDPVVWSLAHELRLSLLFPALLAFARRNFAATCAGALALHLGVLAALPSMAPQDTCESMLRCRPIWGGTIGGSLLLTAYFVLPFVFGIGLALHGRALLARLGSLPGRVRLLLIGVVLFAMNGAVISSDLLFSAGAALLIGLCLSGGRSGLDGPAALWLGRVSYSLYLVHAVVLLALLHLGGPLIAYPAAVLAAAALFHAAVEDPARRLSRSSGRRVAG